MALGGLGPLGSHDSSFFLCAFLWADHGTPRSFGQFWGPENDGFVQQTELVPRLDFQGVFFMFFRLFHVFLLKGNDYSMWFRTNERIITNLYERSLFSNVPNSELEAETSYKQHLSTHRTVQ